MNKDIYSILNSTKNEDNSYGHLNDEEIKDIMERFNSENKTKKSKSLTKIVAMGSAALAAAACLAVFLAVPTANKIIESPVINKYSGSNENSEINENIENTAADESSFSIVNNSFFITADAAETEPPKDMYISRDRDNGCIPYSGTYFYVKGTNIKNVTVSIDKGELYKYKYLKQTDHDNINSDYIGNEYTEPYTDNNCYGLYFSEEIYKKHNQECDGNFKEAWHRCYDDFNDAKLTVSVEYLDGETESITHILKSGKIELDKETMKPNGNISDGSTPYIYGVYFE